MPTYDYVCDACGHAFELFQSMSDGMKKTCPTCGKKKLRRLIGAGGAIGAVAAHSASLRPLLSRCPCPEWPSPPRARVAPLSWRR